MIRQNDHPLPEKVMALPIYVGIPSDRNNSILKTPRRVFPNALSPNRNTNTPYGNIEHTTNAAVAPMVVPCRGAPTSVGHVAATRVTPQQQGAAKRGHAERERLKNIAAAELACGDFCFSVCVALTPTAECPSRQPVRVL